MSPDDERIVLDNAAWHALLGPHAGFRVGTTPAVRYRHQVCVFAATPDNEQSSWNALAALSDGHAVVLFRGTDIDPPSDWETQYRGDGTQMVLESRADGAPRIPSHDPVTGARVHTRSLTDDDVPAMTELVALTEPGPFQPRTIELGGYRGVFHDDRLVAMAGQRMQPPGWCEVSAVCTHPDARRRGYAAVLTHQVARAITSRGERPFLHTAASNHAAQSVYRSLGFRVRRAVSFAVLRPVS
jgi:ribosomal protein S18 acetylase RimI-like enzyme